MTETTAYCLAWLRAHAPHSAVLNYFEFPALIAPDRRLHGERARAQSFGVSAVARPRVSNRSVKAAGAGTRPAAERHLLLDHARRVESILRASS